MRLGVYRATHQVLAVVLCVCIGLTSVGIIAAQDEPAPVRVGENTLGELTADGDRLEYGIEVATSQSINVQLLPITPDFHPSLQVLDPSGVSILSSDSTLPNAISLANVGAYTIVVASSDGTTGQFLLSIQPGAPLAPPTELTPGEAVDGEVDAQSSRQAYVFAGSADETLLLTIDPADEASGLVIALRDADTDEMLSLSSARLGGIRYRILSGAASYLLEITHSGTDTGAAFTLCLESEAAPSCTGATEVISPRVEDAPVIDVTPTQTAGIFGVPINPTDACVVASARGASINVRAGAGTTFGILGNLAANASAPVIGRLADNSWFQVNIGGVPGWVSATVVALNGDCTSVSVVAAPPPPAVVIVPTTAPPVTAPTVPTTMPTVEAPVAPTPFIPLNPGGARSAEYYFAEGLPGGTFLLPEVSAPVGSRTVDLSYLGGECFGYTTPNPAYYISYTGVGATGLRFQFENQGGAAGIVVRGPNGNYRCVSSPGYVEFEGVFILSGDYYVWIVTTFPGSPVGSSSIRLTEIADNPGNLPGL